MVVHELKELLDLDIQETRFAVTPQDLDHLGCYRVTCTITSLEPPQRVDVVVQSEKAIVPHGKQKTRAKPRRR